MKIWLGYSPESPEWRALRARIPDAKLEYDLAEQGSARWHALRMGIPTASRAKDIITPAKGDLSTARFKYAWELVAERLLNAPAATSIDHLPYIEQGKIREGQAREAYGAIVEADPLLIGFMATDDRRYGCSPDSLLWLGERRVGLEIKCPSAKEHVGCWLTHLADSDEGPLRKHKPQMQMQILTGNLSRVDFFSHEPDCPSLLIEFNPDTTFIKKLESHLRTFCDELDHFEALLRKQGFFAPRAVIASDAERLAEAQPTAERLIADFEEMQRLQLILDREGDEGFQNELAGLPRELQAQVRDAIEGQKEFLRMGT